MSVRKAQRPLNGSQGPEPVILLGWDKEIPRVTVILNYENKASYRDPQRIAQLIEDLQEAYGHLMQGPR